MTAEVFVSGGRTATGKKALQWAREAEERGAGEILAHINGPRRHRPGL